jgi:hypothetical protein
MISFIAKKFIGKGKEIISKVNIQMNEAGSNRRYRANRGGSLFENKALPRKKSKNFKNAFSNAVSKILINQEQKQNDIEGPQFNIEKILSPENDNEEDFNSSRIIIKLQTEEIISCILTLMAIVSGIMYHHLRDYAQQSYQQPITSIEESVKNLFLYNCTIVSMLFCI